MNLIEDLIECWLNNEDLVSKNEHQELWELLNFLIPTKKRCKCCGQKHD